MKEEISWRLQKSFFQQLTKRLRKVRIYSSIPHNVEFPYVIISRFKSKDWSASNFHGEQVFNHIQILDNRQSDHQIYEIAAIVRSVVNEFSKNSELNIVKSEIIESEMSINKTASSCLTLKIRTMVIDEREVENVRAIN